MTLVGDMRADNGMERLNAPLRVIAWHRIAGDATHEWRDADHATRTAVRQSWRERAGRRGMKG